ncbi:MAG: creatininase family protein [Gemmatales bacterium]|nr:creatininase family protein [Gemmatales bacterium]MDW7993706.1 creatininase family protein [Gemmatales bacterium]
MRWGEMTWPQLRAVPRDQVVVVAPIAACEQHGPHLPTLTDTILCTAVAEGVEARLPDRVLLLPTLWLGASHHHLPFGATLSLDALDHAALLAHLLRPVLREGFRRVFILNGHGGNIDTMQVALRRLQPEFPDRLLAAASYWETADAELASLVEGPRQRMGHACEMETSMMLALRPELVRLEEAEDDCRVEAPELRGVVIIEDFQQRTRRGSFGYPRRANADKGRKMLEAIIQRIVAVVVALLQRPLSAAQFALSDPSQAS